MLQKMKTTVSSKVSFENETFWREHTETLTKQGHFLCLAIFEKSDMIWKSYMFNLKKLDTFSDKLVKKWTGLPPCATNAAQHLKPGLDITSISTL